MVNSTVLGPVSLANPVLVASGTFGYIREMERFFDLKCLGGILPKTVTLHPRPGNRPPRTVETSSGLLNSIGLDNDGLDTFLEHTLPDLCSLCVPIFLSVAAKTVDEAALIGNRLPLAAGITAVELNVSCPNVSGGVDFGSNPQLCYEMTARFRESTPLPLFVKLSPNVTNIAVIAKAAEDGGADGISAINTCLGLSVDWRNRRARLGNGFGGLSGPAIKPIGLRCVQQIFRAVSIPIIGIGGIQSAEDVLEYIVAGATAVQVGTANFFCPQTVPRILEELPILLQQAGVSQLSELIGTLTIGDSPR